ncbi:MAG: hypothetical protein EU533_02590 [Promethearchaeota archaeon]|nr:MAG: hypothetical protein EU533_02590 [Candidatus Lokiarchaeota archaeon]
MNCERALEILTSVKNREDILCSREEILELMKFSLIEEYENNVPIDQIVRELESLKANYSQINSGINEINKDLLSLERDYEHLSLFSKLLSFFYIGKGRKLKSSISKMRTRIKNENVQVSIIKDQILNLNDQKQSTEQSVKVNGMKVILTPNGDNIIDEISARKRFYSQELSSLVQTIERLDDTFVELINDVSRVMINSSFSAIWAVYMINLNNKRLATAFNDLASKEYFYKNAEKRMMKLSIFTLNSPNFDIPTSSSKIRAIENDMKYSFRTNNPSSDIKKALDKHRIYDSNLRSATTMIGRILSSWAEHHPEDTMSGNNYYDLLVDIFEKKPFGAIFDELRYAYFILPLVEDREKYNYYQDQLKDIPEGSKFFSTVASLFPWDPEETWMVFLRAEMNILKAQSAKFIPELIEYALLLTMNQKIIQIENNISESYLERWTNLVVPIVHLITYIFLEKDLKEYIRRRPLAYIISPRYYYRSSLHYHVIG